MHVFFPAKEKANGSAVIVCPGGGFHILAWDLEGTEVAKWLNELGVTAAVLKYRVPTNRQNPRWLAPVQDAQRALSLTRSKSKEWNLDSNKIGILGFSAGGHTAAVTSYGTKQRYCETKDSADNFHCKPNFSILIYAARMANSSGTQLSEDLKVTSDSPPTFMAHAFDDFVPVQNCLVLMKALKAAKVPSELHIYDRGGHGYGLRKESNKPVTTWPARCAEWMQANGILTPER